MCVLLEPPLVLHVFTLCKCCWNLHFILHIFTLYVFLEPANRFTDHFGYVSLFPILMGITHPTSPHLEQTIKKLSDPKKLWTGYGYMYI